MYTLIYDFETSGLNPYHADVIEIGCKCVETGETYDCLLQPLSNLCISDKIEKITGITNALLKKEGIHAKVGFKGLLDFMKKHYDDDDEIIMIAHNGRTFDDLFLRKIHRYIQGEEHMEYDIMMENIYFIDSLLMARFLYPDRYSHSMDNMCKMFNVTNESAHRAMGDVNALELVWSEMLKKLNHKHTEISGPNLQYITYC